jgi:hypothetical protein
MKEIPVIVADNITEEQEREFVIKDNVSGGEWDWDILANAWNNEDLTEWGVNIPKYESDDIDFDSIEDNSDREASKKEQSVECPSC